MKRIQFLKNAGLAAAGTFALPSLLTSDKLFARSANPKVKHVVLCVLAGGVRNREAIDQAEGALMPRLFGVGKSPASYLINSIGNPASLNTTAALAQQGVLFQSFVCKEGPTSHEAAFSAILKGSYQPFQATNGIADSTEVVESNHLFNRENLVMLNLNADDSRFSLDAVSSQIVNKQESLSIVSIEGADVAHADFTGYCASLMRIDNALANLWEQIQSTPGMQDQTVMLVVPEHGRNKNHNDIQDAYGRFGLDHSTLPPQLGGDQHARESFCLVLGSSRLVKQGSVITDSAESIHIRPFIESLLGNVVAVNPLHQALKPEVIV